MSLSPSSPPILRFSDPTFDEMFLADMTTILSGSRPGISGTKVAMAETLGSPPGVSVDMGRDARLRYGSVWSSEQIEAWAAGQTAFRRGAKQR